VADHGEAGGLPVDLEAHGGIGPCHHLARCFFMASTARGPSTAMAWKWGEMKCASSSQASRMGAALAGMEVSLLPGTLGPPMYRTNWSLWWTALGKMVMVEEEELHPSTLHRRCRAFWILPPSRDA